MRFGKGWAALAAAALAACSLPTMDKQSDAIARQLYNEVRSGADVTQDPHLAHELNNPTTLQELAALRGMIPPGEPTKVETRAWSFNTTTAGTTTHLTHAYRYADRTVIAETALFKSPGGKDPVVVGFNLSLEPASGS